MARAGGATESRVQSSRARGLAGRRGQRVVGDGREGRRREAGAGGGACARAVRPAEPWWPAVSAAAVVSNRLNAAGILVLLLVVAPVLLLPGRLPGDGDED